MLCLLLLPFPAAFGQSPAPKKGMPAPMANGRASKDAPFVNSLGMRFVPVTGTQVLFSIWETRTQDYLAYVESSPGVPKGPPPPKPTHPITHVSWEDAAAFCQWLTAQERKLGKIGPREQYRLPTDKEWSTAVGPTRWPWGDKWPPPKATGKNAFAFIPDAQDNTAPVGSFAPNPFGIHDLAGNVFEWVQDWYRKDMNEPDIRQENERLRDDEGGRKYKVLRGSPWVFYEPNNLRSAYHFINTPNARGALYGFRCVLEVAP
jgi:formylglycine-generating enzyme required for sulfatase activity